MCLGGVVGCACGILCDCAICEYVLHAWEWLLCVGLCMLCVLCIVCNVCMLWLCSLCDCFEVCTCLVYVWCVACVDVCVWVVLVVCIAGGWCRFPACFGACVGCVCCMVGVCLVYVFVCM